MDQQEVEEADDFPSGLMKGHVKNSRKDFLAKAKADGGQTSLVQSGKGYETCMFIVAVEEEKVSKSNKHTCEGSLMRGVGSVPF